ncbi:uncharacterized protein PAC_12552 [Phialocephala subalpina]|uniref:AAA+ ATPase domain-containing protein n=1 Tax=Phialocephala subalpina TaxID=576137 RepID=A0A1L7XCC0_9HELO|nr:uncharacterized protein PAC_12552 [Phialocephala subalpina]
MIKEEGRNARTTKIDRNSAGGLDPTALEDNQSHERLLDSYQKHNAPSKGHEDFREPPDEEAMSQPLPHLGVEVRAVIERFTQQIFDLEQRVMELERNQGQGMTSDTAGGALDGETMGEGASQTRLKTPPVNTSTTGTDPTAREGLPIVAKPNKFSGNVRVSYVTFQDNKPGGNTKKIETKPPFEKPEEEDKEQETPSLIFSTFIDDKGKWTRTEIEIKSKALIDFLREFLFDMLKHTGSLPGWSQESSVNVSSRFLVSVPNYEKLKMISQGDENHADIHITNETKEQLKCLIDHVDQYETAHIQMRKSTEKLREVTSEGLWTLFPVGTEVVGKWFMETRQIFVVKDFVSISPVAGFGMGAYVVCWCYDWDGQKLVKTVYTFHIKETRGPKSIVDLPCYPLQYDPKKDELLSELIERGRQFRELYLESQRSGNLLKCQGPVLQVGGLTQRRKNPDTSDDEDDDKNDENYQRYGSSEGSFDIIVDAATLIRDYGIMIGKENARTEYNECTCMYCKRKGSESWEALFRRSVPNVDDNLSKDFSYLLPPRVLGVLVKQKLFAQLPVKQISRTYLGDFDEGWNKLQLDTQHKLTVKNMVAARLKHEPQSEQTVIRDLIPGKGEGLVILLHGVPGVGKTTTAEALARYLKRHILRIDASDFDYQHPGQVGSILKKYFQLAYSWGVILLLDEADVFLQARTQYEIKQNALVSVLLTEVEYFQGVLIMTTNRIMTIDIAVQSRLNYAIRFEYLSADALRNIFGTFQAMLDDSNCDTDERENIRSWVADNVEEMRDKGTNGRDVRNLFMGTQWLAEKDGGRIRLSHLKSVYQATQKFRSEMEKIRIQKEAESSVVTRSYY